VLLVVAPALMALGAESAQATIDVKRSGTAVTVSGGTQGSGGSLRLILSRPASGKVDVFAYAVGGSNTLASSDGSCVKTGLFGDFVCSTGGPEITAVTVDLSGSTNQIHVEDGRTPLWPNAVVTMKLGAGNDAVDTWMDPPAPGLRVDIDAGAGNDIVHPGVSGVLRGGPGDDHLDGGLGDDQLYGDDGNDQLQGRAGNDVEYGGPGDDYFTADAGDDQSFGEAGNDTFGFSARGWTNLSVYTGEAAPCGADGNDLWDGGSDTLTGPGDAFGGPLATMSALLGGIIEGPWAGDRLHVWVDCKLPVRASLAGVAGNGTAGENDRIVNIESLAGGSADDDLTGDDRANVLIGGSGADAIHGAGGNDLLVGGMGPDTLFGDAGDDQLWAAEFSDDLSMGGPDVDKSVDCGPGTDVAWIERVDPATACEAYKDFYGRPQTGVQSTPGTSGGGGGGGGGGSGGPVVSAAGAITFKSPSKLVVRLGGFTAATATCPTACTVSATAKVGSTVVARGRRTLNAAGSVAVKLTLTKAGKRKLRASRKLRVKIAVTVTPKGRKATSTSVSKTLA